MEPSRAAQKFDVTGRLVHVNAIGRGNVNDTYEAVFRDGGAVERIIIQRINRHVFEHPEWIMSNMRLVTDFFRNELDAEARDVTREWGIPQIVKARSGEDFLVVDDGEFWRAMTCIDDATSYPKVRDSEHAHELGIVLGCFHRLIAGLSCDSLRDPLPGFHVTPRYLEKYDHTLATDGVESRMSGSAEVAGLLAFVEKRREFVNRLEDGLERGELSTRPIHGDPKVDNIMIDDFTGYGIGIIDLDTVKPGLLHYDFGDALRSACNPAGEDETDLSSVYFDVDLCEAFVKGYVAQAHDFLTDKDRRYLYDAIRMMTFELGLRFLQDYLAGDVYFKVRFEEHNLNRAKVQFKLCQSIEANEKAIRAVLDQSK